jgi:hypothetical protein
VPINTKELQPTSFIFSLRIQFLFGTAMASSSSNPASKKTKCLRDTSPPPPLMPEKYKIHGVTQECWDKFHSEGQYGTERQLVELYNKRIARLEEQNKKDQEIILVHQNKVNVRNQ